MSLFEQACFSCGEPGHFAGQCPNRKSKPRAPAYSPPPEPPRRPASAIADPGIWAARIREEMGWERGNGNRRSLTDLETLAREQVGKSRTGRPVVDQAEG